MSEIVHYNGSVNSFFRKTVDNRGLMVPRF